jgi:hypothetical protein
MESGTFRFLIEPSRISIKPLAAGALPQAPIQTHLVASPDERTAERHEVLAPTFNREFRTPLALYSLCDWGSFLGFGLLGVYWGGEGVGEC